MALVEKYNGALTAEQFLFYEIRIAAKFYLKGTPVEEASSIIKRENLFQYPTEREVSRMVRTCYKRLTALGDESLVRELASAPVEIAKQINLYAMMRYNRLMWEFMTQVIGEKFRNQDFALPWVEMNAFFSRLQGQNDDVARWSESTVSKLKSVIVRALVETEYLDSFKDEKLNPVYLYEELERGIRSNGDLEALPAFNCFQ